MAEDTKYAALPFVFRSKGINARLATDRMPEYTYLNMESIEEREEDALSSRYGSVIVNRDPNGTVGGVNYPLPATIRTLTRLKTLNNQTYRYAGLANGQLLRRTGDIQGPYSPIASGLSGQRFSSAIVTMFESATPYLIIADSSLMLKDTGTGTPTGLGIFAPTQVCNTLPFAPAIQRIENFTSAAGFTHTGFTISGLGTIATVNGIDGTPTLDYTVYQCADNSIKNVQNGMLAKNGISTLSNIFNISPVLVGSDRAFSITPDDINATDTFTFGYLSGVVAANTIATLGKSITLDLSTYQTDDLIILVVKIDNPATISGIAVQFDVAGSNYTSSYYSKSIIPSAYQAGITEPSTSSPNDALTAEVMARAIGLVDPTTQVGAYNQPNAPSDDPAINQLQPSQLTTGAGSWSVILLRKGDFLPVGNAGLPALDWSAITGWRLQITTNTQGSPTISLNSLYIQGGPNSGPSSFGGVGYDYRATFYDANTGTESNPNGEQYYSQLISPFTGESTLIVLRQAIAVTGTFSLDPQVTHVRVYRRGGTFNNNWYYLDQFLNNPVGGQWQYTDILADSVLEQSNTLNLANDVPVTSSLQNPIVTTLSAPLTPTAPFLPITVTVIDGAAVFVPNQIVDIGTPANLEQVLVVVGGVGTFTGCVQLPHDVGEAVQVFSIPGQPLPYVAIAYNLVWYAGDPNNPHFLYYCNPGYPENVSPASYIPCGSASDPIMAVINFRGTLFVATQTTWYQIFAGSPPYAQSTGSKHGLAAPFGWTQTESAVWFCLPDDESEILTRQGWKSREQLIVGEEVLAYDIKTKSCKWTPVRRINVFDYDGELIHWTGGSTNRKFDFSCTPDHKWVWRSEALPHKNGARTERLRGAYEIATAGNLVQFASIDNESDSILTPREAAILGWLITDGSITNNVNGGKRSSRIYQSEESRYVEAIRELLGVDLMSTQRRTITKGYGEKYGKQRVMLAFCLSTDFTERLFKKAGFETHEDLPQIVCKLNLASAKAMLETMIDGDGSRGGAITFGQNKGPVMEAFRLLALLCGHATSAPNFKKKVGYRKEHGYTTLATNPRLDCQTIKRSKRQFKGKVWCPTTDFGTWVARSNNTFSITGNCAIDGIRVFRGADGPYASLAIEWLFQNQPTTPSPTPIIPLMQSQISQTVMAYWNNLVFIVYFGTDSQYHRLIFDDRPEYQRWRNDDVHATAIILEADTNTLLYGEDFNGLTPYPLSLPVIGVAVVSIGGGLCQIALNFAAPPTFLVGESVTLSNFTGLSTFLNGLILTNIAINDSNQVTSTITLAHSNYGSSIPGTATGLSTTGAFVIQDRIGDYDDGGWSPAHALIQTPIDFILQTPYLDLGKPNNQKQWNMVTIDANTKGQDIDVTLLFDDNNGTVAALDLGLINGALRQKFELVVRAGFGQQAYRMSLLLTGSVTVAPIIYQSDIQAAVLAEQASSLDTYWIKFGSEESKACKQGFFDYTSTDPIVVSLYADGNTTPYYTFTLPANPNRYQSPVRVRFPALKFRQFRLIALVQNEGMMQFWAAIQLDIKPILAEGSKSWGKMELAAPYV